MWRNCRWVSREFVGIEMIAAVRDAGTMLEASKGKRAELYV